MNKKIIFLLIIIGFFLYGIVDAETYYYDFIQVEIQINKDSTFDVIERQAYYLDGSFGYFYRDIELKDLDHISDVEVFDSDGRKLSKEEYEFKYKGNRLHIQWDFDRRDFNNELKKWTVKYKVHGGLGFFDNYDELYWNAIFQDRDVVIKQAEVIVNLPQEVDEIKTRLFVGKSGSTTESNNYQVIDAKTVKFWGKNLMPGEYLTIVAAWPKGIVQKPFLYRNQLINLIVLFIALLIPIIVFIKAFTIWREKGRDPKIKKTIIAHYSPPDNLSPAVVGVLIKQSVDVKDILATVVNLAVRGYLRIREQENKFLFIKNKEYIFEKLKQEGDLKPFEQEIMKTLFKKGDLISSKDLRNKFYKELPDIKKEIYKEVASTGLFNENIEKIRKKYTKLYGVVIILLLIAIAGIAFLIAFLGLPYIPQIIILAFSLIASAIIGISFAYYMPVVTVQGLEAKWKALGFKEYLNIAERFRIGSETLETFSKFLPYAIVFGVEKQWAKRFSDFDYQKQGWYYPAAVYSGSGGRPGSFSEFSSSFSSFASSVSTTFSSSPGGSGAGGAAGGGGGGGGGGAG